MRFFKWLAQAYQTVIVLTKVLNKFTILILQQIVSTSSYEQKPKSMKETGNQKSLKF